jgi:hypothetical protein
MISFRWMGVFATLAAPLLAQNLHIVQLGHFPPGQPTTFAFPSNAVAAAEYSKCTGLREPATGREFAMAGADNGIVFVNALPPAHSSGGLSNVNSWFFEDLPVSRWRGVASFRDHVYAVSRFHAGIRRFLINTSPPTPATWITDLGYSNTNEIDFAGPRTTVDAQHGHLYLVGVRSGLPRLFVYDVLDNVTQAVIDPPVLLAEWTPGGLIWDVSLRGDRAYLAYQQNGAANWWRIIDVLNLRTTPPNPPSSWNPPFAEFQNTQLGGQLSHDSYMSPDQTKLFVTNEGDHWAGHMTGRNMGSTLPPLNNQVLQEPPVIGTYHQQASLPEPMHSIRGLGMAAFVSHWTAGLHLIDISTNPGGLDYPLMASFDTSPLTNNRAGDGAWDSYPYQDSGVVYVSDSELGLFVLRVDAGHLNRYGTGTSNGTSIPRIEGNIRPPRINSTYVMEIRGMTPMAAGALELSLGEDPSYLNGTPQTLMGATVLVDLASAASFLFVADAQGSFSHNEVIPNSPALVGMKLFAQVFELVNANSLAASRGTWFGIAP